MVSGLGWAGQEGGWLPVCLALTTALQLSCHWGKEETPSSAATLLTGISEMKQEGKEGLKPHGLTRGPCLQQRAETGPASGMTVAAEASEASTDWVGSQAAERQCCCR